MNMMTGREFRQHVDANRELLNSAFHEAGHVMAARYFGFRVAWVSIDPEFIRRDPLAIKNEVAHAGEGVFAVAMVVASEKISDQVATNARERQILRNYGVEILCGPFAEQLVNPDWWQTADADKDQAKYWLARCGGSKEQRHLNKAFNQIERDAMRFVERNSEVIEKFAHFLIAERTIRESEIDPFIAKAKASANRLAP
jgi:hypothetical protein